MAGKRRRGSRTGDGGHTKAKKTKFTLDSAHIPAIEAKGAVFVTGTGDFGQLGLGSDVLEKSRPALLKLDEEIVDICAGGMHTVCLTKDGKVYTFGCNDEGALGRVTAADEEEAEFTPRIVELPGKVIQISAGDSHTAALLPDGRVFAWGTFRDSHGNMGLTQKGNEKLPFEIIPGQHVMKIGSGADHIVFLTKKGEVFTCGCAEQGQLGRTSMRGSGRNARNSAGQLEKLLIPQPIALKASAKLHFDDVWAGMYATFAKVADKEDVYVFGLNNYYQIGLEAIQPQYNPVVSKEFSKHKWEMICSAQHHTVALTTDGKVYVTGRKEYGRLGLGEGCDDAKELTEVPFFKGKKVVSIGTGSATSFAITEEGELFGWGMGSVGQLGNGKEEDCFEPTAITSKAMAGLKVLRVMSGGQHTIILASKNENNNKSDGDNET